MIPFRRILAYCFLYLFICPIWSQHKVKIWEEPLTLPTYLTKAPDKNPMFFSNQSYQGASRSIYPYKLQDNLTNQKEDRTYKGLYLENEYIKLCVLPEIGGRLFYATDKTNGYEMFYRQHVIKPANIGMLGAWISGGIEFCVFHHHRASTNIPVEYRLIENKDGSATIWIGETEPRHRMKWTLGIKLYPGKSYVEVDGRLINPTASTNSILYWANVATHVNDDYQIIFPPSTEFAVFHAKNSFAHWPITSNTYNGKTHYKDNIDASWWKNHPDPVSMFAHDIKEGFIAGYDHGQKAGTMHVANHHIVKGAKLWEWGPGDYGTMWDSKVLTDSDGPYAEIMTGAYSDNQPDYSWLKPYEYKTFHQYWYPLRETGGAKSANLHAAINLTEITPTKYSVAINTTQSHQDAQLIIKNHDEILLESKVNITPAQPFNGFIDLLAKDEVELSLALFDQSGRELIFYTPEEKTTNPPLPDPVIPPRAPTDIKSIEELYLTGLRIKQFHNARIDPTAYFKEALKRDPLDARCNNMMGILAKQNFKLDEASQFFRTALIRTTANYTRPRDCEPFFHLGTILQAKGNLEAAYDTLYRAAWDQNYASPAYFHLAQISVKQKKLNLALTEVNRSLDYNSSNLSAKNLKISILRALNQKVEATKVAIEVLDKDALNAYALNESNILGFDQIETLGHILQSNPESYLELAIQYLNNGLENQAIHILQLAIDSGVETLKNHPTIHYYLGHLLNQVGDQDKSKTHLEYAARLTTDYCFPYRFESMNVLQQALEINPSDAHAAYYLGNLLYEKQPEVAIKYWEQAVELKPTLARAHRNLGWGYNQALGDVESAISAYEKAITHDESDPKFYFELDKLYEKNRTNVRKRYALLTRHHESVRQRPDALLREIKVILLNQKSDLAIEYLLNNFFPRQEGVDNLHNIYVDACLTEGIARMQKNKNDEALQYFMMADHYPENHQIGRNTNADKDAQVFYYQGLGFEKIGQTAKATSSFQKVTSMDITEPEYKFYQSLSYQKLGNKSHAFILADEIQDEAKELLTQPPKIDFFSKFGQEQSDHKRKANALYLQALSDVVKENQEEAIANFRKSIELDPSNLWARVHLQNI